MIKFFFVCVCVQSGISSSEDVCDGGHPHEEEDGVGGEEHGARRVTLVLLAEAHLALPAALRHAHVVNHEHVYVYVVGATAANLLISCNWDRVVLTGLDYRTQGANTVFYAKKQKNKVINGSWMENNVLRAFSPFTFAQGYINFSIWPSLNETKKKRRLVQTFFLFLYRSPNIFLDIFAININQVDMIAFQISCRRVTYEKDFSTIYGTFEIYHPRHKKPSKLRFPDTGKKSLFFLFSRGLHLGLFPSSCKQRLWTKTGRLEQDFFFHFTDSALGSISFPHYVWECTKRKEF